VLRDATPGSPRHRRFEREVRLAGSVQHPNLLPVLDVGHDAERAWVVTELLEGRTLRARLREGPLSPREAVAIGIQVARGLAALHERGIVHRDVKPENLFLTADGGVRVLDLGLAKRGGVEEAVLEAGGESEFSTVDGGVAGTAAYMSPEQVRRLRVEPRSDIFALGIVLYEMLGRRRPFDEETAVETMTAILRRDPPPLESIAPVAAGVARLVERCLEKEPVRRFHSAHDLALALEAAVPGEPRRRRGWPAGPLWAIGGAVGLAAVLLAGWPAAPVEESAGPPTSRDGKAWVTAAGPVTVSWGEAAAEPARHAAKPPVGPGELLRYDFEKRSFEPYLEGRSAEGLDFSRDGSWVAWISLPERQLWRARADGREALRLTEPPLVAALPRWSPDGKTLAFAAHTRERPWRLHLVSVDGGPLEVLPPDQAVDPSWSPDGSSLLFGGMSDEKTGIYEIDLATGRYRLLPGTLGLFSPRWSPDGRHLAALRLDSQGLVVRERDGAWRDLVSGSVDYPSWSGSDTLYFRWSPGTGDPSEPDGVYRATLEGPPELVASLEDVALTGGDWGGWTGVTPDGRPLALRVR